MAVVARKIKALDIQYFSGYFARKRITHTVFSREEGTAATTEEVKQACMGLLEKTAKAS